MNSLQHWQEKIQERRKKTSFRDFLLEIASWNTVNLYRNHGQLSRYPESGREGNIVDIALYNPADIVSMDYQGGPFFDALMQLFREQPKMRLMQWFENENSEYAEVYGGKNCYLSIGVGGVENTAYSTSSYGQLTNIYNAFSILGTCSNIYASRVITDSYNIYFSSNIHNSSNIRFSTNLIGCTECLLCEGLDNQSYCIRNTQYTKEEYAVEKEKILADKNTFESLYNTVLNTLLHNKVSTNVTGAGIVASQNIIDGHFVRNLSGGRNLIICGGDLSTRDFYDTFDSGNQGDSDLYGVHYCGENSAHVYCSSSVANGSNVFYSYFLEGCSFCLGCVGLKNKSYCILNKQYMKEDRYEKVDEIFSQMESEGALGAFLPPRMNPFYFNDTAAYLMDPSFTKEEVTKLGYMRRDAPIKVDIPDWMEIINTTDLGQYEGYKDGERAIDPSILKKVIIDEEGNSYRVVKLEYDFLVKHGLPLPRKHWLERMKDNFRL